MVVRRPGAIGSYNIPLCIRSAGKPVWRWAATLIKVMGDELSVADDHPPSVTKSMHRSSRKRGAFADVADPAFRIPERPLPGRALLSALLLAFRLRGW